MLNPPNSDFQAAQRQLPPNPTVAIVGASGVVGRELIASLATRDFPLRNLRLLASARSAGTEMAFGEETLVVEELSESSFEGVDLVFFAAGAGTSRAFAPHAVRAGAIVVDNSSAFRMDANVPLIVPEANTPAMAQHQGVIANPNCVAAVSLVALAPLHARWPIQRINMATYQAASGAGAAALQELHDATGAALRGEEFTPEVMPHPYAFNIFSHNSDMDLASGYNGEESKVIAETRRILGLPELPIGVTCIRVPILRAHGMAISVEFAEAVDPHQARALLMQAPGLRVVDDRKANYFPMPSDASGIEDVLVGRIRTDLGDPSGRTLAMFVVGDQLLKGAALNAVQIAEALLPVA